MLNINISDSLTPWNWRLHTGKYQNSQFHVYSNSVDFEKVSYEVYYKVLGKCFTKTYNLFMNEKIIIKLIIN